VEEELQRMRNANAITTEFVEYQLLPPIDEESSRFENLKRSNKRS